MKKIKFLKLIFILSLMFCSKWIFKNNVYAEGLTMTVYPMAQRIILNPGETYHGTINVFNPNSSETDLEYSTSVSPFSMFGNEYEEIDLSTIGTYNQIVDWITIDDGEGVVSPNETKTVSYSIEVPENAPSSGQYASIRITNNATAEAEEGNKSAIEDIVEIASIIYATIPGETVEKGSVIENSIPSFILQAPLSVSSVVKNEGNVHTDASYILQVFPLFSNEEIYTNEEEPTKNIVMPETQLYHSQSWDEMPSVGIFKVKQTVQIFDQISTTEKIVIACPLWLLAIIVFIIVAIIIWLIAKSKSRKKSIR